MKEIDKNIVLNLLLLLVLQARLQARQVKNGDKRHHYKGLTCDNFLLHTIQLLCVLSVLLFWFSKSDVMSPALLDLDAMCLSRTKLK
jgi:hypothetical protein